MHRLCRNRGRRIRPSDKDLVFRTVFFLLFVVFAVTFALLNIRTDWRNPSVAYLLFSAAMGGKVCTVTIWLLYRRFPDKLNEMRHRQKLARMVLENQWYEQSDTKQSEGFFKDLPASSKPKIARFPRMYYRMENGLLHITAEITLGKFQEPLLHLENKLESGLYCELISRELLDGFVEYTLLYDMIANRIPISEVRVEHGKMRLMQNTYWEFDSLPHMLIAGGTGGGKTYFILTLIRALLENNAVLHILDPKNADLADLSSVLPNVCSRKEEIVQCITDFCTAMHERSADMKRMENYKTGENYAYLGLPPQFLVFDEYVAFMEMLTNREREDVLNKLRQIVMLGRQAGFFLILACQRPDAKYLGDGIRDQFNFRVALGRNVRTWIQHDVRRNEKGVLFQEYQGQRLRRYRKGGDYGVLYSDRAERV